MKVLILFATTEGQTRKVATFLRDRLAEAGHAPQVLEAGDNFGLDPGIFDRVVIAASLHAGRYQKAIVGFAAAHHVTLNRMHAAFVSVSLAAAGRDLEDRQGLADCVAAFEHDTGWHPARVQHVAGAFRFSAYDFFKRWAMKYIAWRKKQPTDTSRDYELTDWVELGRFIDDFAGPVPEALSAAGHAPRRMSGKGSEQSHAEPGGADL